jgi:hypothetical protein
VRDDGEGGHLAGDERDRSCADRATGN